MIECFPRKVHKVDGFFKICISAMKIREKDLLEDEVSPQVLGYTSWKQSDRKIDA